jgi:hypothetical protein
LAVRHDVQSVLLHLLNLVLAGRHDQRHVRRLEDRQARLMLLKFESVPSPVLIERRYSSIVCSGGL